MPQLSSSKRFWRRGRERRRGDKNGKEEREKEIGEKSHNWKRKGPSKQL